MPEPLSKPPGMFRMGRMVVNRADVLRLAVGMALVVWGYDALFELHQRKVQQGMGKLRHQEEK